MHTFSIICVSREEILFILRSGYTIIDTFPFVENILYKLFQASLASFYDDVQNLDCKYLKNVTIMVSC